MNCQGPQLRAELASSRIVHQTIVHCQVGLRLLFEDFFCVNFLISKYVFNIVVTYPKYVTIV